VDRRLRKRESRGPGAAPDPRKARRHSSPGGGASCLLQPEDQRAKALAFGAGREALLTLIQFIAESFPGEKAPARRAAAQLPLITRLAEYQVGRQTIPGSDRFTPAQWEQLEQTLETAEGFRRWLSRKNLFLAELEAGRINEILPGDREIFIGLPELTPPREKFYRKIKKDRLFIDPPLYGPEPAAAGLLPFDSAKNLARSFGADVWAARNPDIEFLRLAGLHAAADWVTLEVSRFLGERSETDRLRSVSWMNP